MSSDYLSAADLARRYSVNRTTIWRRVQAGKLPKPTETPMGNIWKLADVAKWEKKQKDRDRE